MNFEFEFNSEDDIEEMFDSFVDKIRENIIADEEKVTILNPLRLAQIRFTYSVMRYLTKGTDIMVTYKLNEPSKAMGSVSVEGETLEITNSKWFARAVEFANNIEIYPLAKGGVRLTFTFHNLTTPIA